MIIIFLLSQFILINTILHSLYDNLFTKMSNNNSFSIPIKYGLNDSQASLVSDFPFGIKYIRINIIVEI